MCQNKEAILWSKVELCLCKEYSGEKSQQSMFSLLLGESPMALLVVLLRLALATDGELLIRGWLSIIARHTESCSSGHWALIKGSRLQAPIIPHLVNSQGMIQFDKPITSRQHRSAWKRTPVYFVCIKPFRFLLHWKESALSSKKCTI